MKCTASLTHSPVTSAPHRNTGLFAPGLFTSRSKNSTPGTKGPKSKFHAPGTFAPPRPFAL